MILAAVAMLLAIVQASVLIAHNISDPIRRLSEVCRGISGDPGKENQLGEEYLNKTDEVGQELARAFQKMMEPHPGLHRRAGAGQDSQREHRGKPASRGGGL